MNSVIKCGNVSFNIGERTYIMGIINSTPDSFTGDGLVDNIDEILLLADEMIRDGADILDIGGESTRPGSDRVGEDEEINRVLPVITAIKERFDIPLSIDTYKSNVALAAISAGANMVNDISGLKFDNKMADVTADSNVPIVLMHTIGDPKIMQKNPQYDDIIEEIICYLQISSKVALQAGVKKENIIWDPGFGFGKTIEHNLEIIRRLDELKSFGYPVLIGTSRKSTIGKLLNDAPVNDRLEGTAATVALSIANGVDFVRVHDVKEMKKVVIVSDAIIRKSRRM
jgi:dihydropteroate synthase